MKKALAIGMWEEADIWFRAAHEIGYDVVLVHPAFPKGSSLHERTKDYITEWHQADYADFDRIHEIGKRSGIEMVLCQPCPNYVLRSVAAINSRMGLPGLSRDTMERVGNKLNFHFLLEKLDLPRPKFTTRLEDFLPRNQSDFPYIIKPAMGAGGRGIVKIDSQVDLDRFNQNLPANRLENEDFFLCQEFVSARYHMGLNCVVKDGELLILSHNVRDLSLENWAPYFRTNIFPHQGDGFLTSENLALIHKLIKFTGLDNWPLKIEVFLDDDKSICSFIEINLRPGGTRSPLAFSRILGFDYAKEQVKLASQFHEGDFSPHSETKDKALMIKNLEFKPGTVRSIKWFEPNENIVSFHSKLKPGSVISDTWNIKTAQDNGELILVARDEEALLNIAETLESQIKIEYE